MFLVDAATRAVLWSIYEPPKNTSPGELDRTAQRIVGALKAAGQTVEDPRFSQTSRR